MPYKNNASLPSAIRNALPDAAQSIWRGAYTSFTASNKDASEASAFKVAWAAVKGKYRKVKDQWVKLEDAMPRRKPLDFSIDSVQHNVSLFDSFILDGVRRTSDGYLAAYANVARTGIQTYKGKELGRPDLRDVKVYRPPAEVFHQDAMHSMAHRPVTLTHPNETVNAKNWKKYAMGHTGDEVVRDGDHVRVPMLVMDAAAISAIENNDARELSMGYSTDLKWGKGKTTDGEPYDAVQTAIRANHLAIVPTARGGSTLKLGDEADDTCPKCGMEVSEDDDVCPYCQEDLTQDADLGDDKDEHGYGSNPRGDSRKQTHFVTVRHSVKEGGVGKTTTFSTRVLASSEIEARKEGLKVAFDRGLGRHNAQVVSSRVLTGEHEQLKQRDAIVDDALVTDKDFSTERRKTLAKSGAALPDGSFPIESTSDLANAIKAYGRASNPSAAKAHIIKRAKSLGATSQLPDDWVKSIKDAASSGLNLNDDKDEHGYGSYPRGGGGKIKLIPGSSDNPSLFPEHEGKPISWSMGLHHTHNEESAGFPKMRAVIQAMIEHRPNELEQERKGLVKASLTGVFKHNAAKQLKVIEEELAKSRSTKDAAYRGSSRGAKLMNTIIVDGVPVEIDDVGAAVVKKLMARLDDAEKASAKSKADQEEADEEDEKMQKDHKAALDAKDGEIVALKKQLSDAQALNSPEKLDALVKDRLAVTDAASKILPSNFVFDGKTVTDIRKAAVTAKLGDTAAKEMNDAAIEGAFKALTADAARSGPSRLADSIARSHQQSNGQRGTEDIRDAAMAEREKNLNNAWRGKQTA